MQCISIGNLPEKGSLTGVFVQPLVVFAQGAFKRDWICSSFRMPTGAVTPFVRLQLPLVVICQPTGGSYETVEPSNLTATVMPTGGLN